MRLALLLAPVMLIAAADVVVQTPALQWAAVVLAICGVATVAFQYLHTRSQGHTNVRLREIDLGIKQLDDNQARRAEESAERERSTSVKVQEVKETLRENAQELVAKTEALAKEETLQKLHEDSARESRKLDGLAKVSQASHEFLNSERGVTLREKAADKRRIAAMSREPRDIEVADEAEEAARRHDEAQHRVNSQEGTDAEKKGHAE